MTIWEYTISYLPIYSLSSSDCKIQVISKVNIKMLIFLPSTIHPEVQYR
jgi:hypothetical protein